MTTPLRVHQNVPRRTWLWALVLLVAALAIGALFLRRARESATRPNESARHASARPPAPTVDATAVRRPSGTTSPKTPPSTAAPARQLVQRRSHPWPLPGKRLQLYAQVTRSGMERYDPNAARDIPVVMDVIYGNVAALQRALSAGISPNLQVRTNRFRSETFSLLTFAIASGQINSVKELVNDGASVVSGDLAAADAAASGLNGLLPNAPLPDAAARGETTVVRFLLDHGANTDQVDAMGNTALENAVEGGYYSTAKLLLARGANLNDVLRPGGEVPAYLATATGAQYAAIRKLLISYGAIPWNDAPHAPQNR